MATHLVIVELSLSMVTEAEAQVNRPRRQFAPLVELHVGLHGTDGHVQLIEIVIDLGRKPVARFQQGEAQLSDGAASHELLESVVSQVRIAPVPSMHLGCCLSTNCVADKYCQPCFKC